MILGTLPDTMYFGASKRVDVLKGKVFLTPHIGIASLFIVDEDDLFAQLPKGYDYMCNLSYRQWNLPNEALASPLKTLNVLHNIAELDGQIYTGQSGGYIHVVDISDKGAKDKLSLFTSDNPDREMIYSGDASLPILECIPHTCQWDFAFCRDNAKEHGFGKMTAQA